MSVNAKNTANVVKINRLKKSYKDKVAVKEIDLEIKRGDIHGILGPNGAGKSTLLSCVTGLIDYDNGEVLFEDRYRLKSWSKYIGYVPQELAIYPELSPYENVRFFASLYGYRGEELERRVLEAIDFVGLIEVKDKKSSEFSGGMKRRLNLACAIAHSPKLIIMDEPTVGIDPQSRNRILENVKELNKQGVTVIYTTHYMEEVEAICNQITVIDHGKVIANGTKEEIKNKMGSGVVFLLKLDKEAGNKLRFLESLNEFNGIKGVNEQADDEDIRLNRWSVEIKCADAELMSPILQIASANRMVIRSVAQKDLSLEEIFLVLTGTELRD